MGRYMISYIIRMTLSSAVCLFAVSTSVFATSLHYPLVYEKNIIKNGRKTYKPTLVSTLNPLFVKAEIPPFSDSVELIDAKQAGQILTEKSKALDEARTKAHLKENAELVRYSMSAATNSELRNSHGNRAALCYTGNASEAVALINGLTDIAFSDQMGMLGYRYRHEEHFGEGVDTSDKGWLPKIWKEWSGTGAAILYAWHETDDGDDVNTAIIPKCDR